MCLYTYFQTFPIKIANLQEIKKFFKKHPGPQQGKGHN